MTATDYRHLAAQLNELVDSPRFAGKRWSWLDIGLALEISAVRAQRLVQWMRHNTEDIYWTVGTIKTDYLIVPTKSRRDALDGLINQARHLLTRLLAMQRAYEVLSRVDPDPLSARISARAAVHYRIMVDLETVELGALQDETTPAPAPSSV